MARKESKNIQEDAENGMKAEIEDGGPFVTAVQSTRMPMVISDPTVPGNPIIFANDSFLALTGYEREEVLGQSYHFMMGADTDPDARAQIEAASDEGFSATYPEVLYYRKDGSTFWAIIFIGPVFDENHAVVQHFASFLDVTRRKQSERRFRDFAECASDWMWETDSNGRFTYFSGRVTEVLGYEISELIGMRWRDLLAQDGTIEQIEQAVHQQQPFRELEYELVAKDGDRRVVVISGTPVIGDNGAFLGYRGTGSDVTQREHTLAALKRNEERFHEIAETIRDVFWVSDPNKQRMMYVSPAYEDIWGTSPQELYDNPTSFMDAIHEDDIDRMREAIARQADGLYYEEEYRIRRPDGEERWIRDRGYPVHDTDGYLVRVIGVAQDITAQRRLEHQYQQAQKMEAVGQLTGGVAHDFNNLLTVILGNAEAVLADMDKDNAHYRLISMIGSAAERAADLTQRLLAFSSRQPLDPKAVDVNELVGELEPLLKRTLGAQYDIQFICQDGIDKAVVDSGQLENAIVNLAVNARDAMPEGGRLTIETAEVQIDADYVETHIYAEPGRYVMIAVGDDGAGMSPEVRSRVFEPFFTTKGVGEGTGLGLSMVYGFIKQSNGHVNIYSELGEGTTVKLYLPCGQGRDVTEDYGVARETVSYGSERVLVVEDDMLVREYTTSSLTSLGYDVTDVADGPAARALLEDDGTFDLLLCDVILGGGMNGRQVAEAAQEVLPDLKVLYMSGYTENVIVHHGRLDAGARLLLKPFRRADLAKKVREALDDGD